MDAEAHSVAADHQVAADKSGGSPFHRSEPLAAGLRETPMESRLGGGELSELFVLQGVSHAVQGRGKRRGGAPKGDRIRPSYLKLNFNRVWQFEIII